MNNRKDGPVISSEERAAKEAIDKIRAQDNGKLTISEKVAQDKKIRSINEALRIHKLCIEKRRPEEYCSSSHRYLYDTIINTDYGDRPYAPMVAAAAKYVEKLETTGEISTPCAIIPKAKELLPKLIEDASNEKIDVNKM